MDYKKRQIPRRNRSKRQVKFKKSSEIEEKQSARMDTLALSVFIEEKPSRFRARHLDFVDQGEASNAAAALSKKPKKGLKGWGKGKKAVTNTTIEEEENSEGASILPRKHSTGKKKKLLPRNEYALPSPPLSTSEDCQNLEIPRRGSGSLPNLPQSKFVDGPVDERDEIIEALSWELEHEHHLKTKARWDMNDEYLAELDTFAPETLAENFHDKILKISERFFPQSIMWRIMANRIGINTKKLVLAKKWFPAFIKLPCTPETWPRVISHPDMTCALFVEGVIANTLATQMCHCPALQAEGDLASYLDTFYYHCMSIGPGTLDAAEWMALTLQLMKKMTSPDRTNPRYRYQADIPEIKTVEESVQTKDIIWALCETIRMLRDCVTQPLTASESKELNDMVTDLVVTNFKLSVEWHMKPLAFKQQGPAWHLRSVADGDDKNLDMDDESLFVNADTMDPTQDQQIVAVISPTLLREEWDKPEKMWWQGQIWMKPRLLAAPVPSRPKSI
ncbi:hypothetical protein H072_2447 [Dactylellina haptotyla CBS 200.50]|uniref:Uncharacterized protein n=1 Tax=Dactylellina haptotyla (strain CBS 200.50) TaxID=1284197 RepID=S8AKY3_DACHA|nr:hypothetical protein H072_2447 [Dactylellina haptotyla CBS 200.50]